MYNKYIYQKGYHLVEVQEVDNLARVNGLKGWLDSIELLTLLLNNGYKIVR